MNHYPHHIGDYLKDTAHLDPLEDGIYRRMIDLYYTQEGPLFLDMERLCRRLRLDIDKHGAVVKDLLNEFFRQTETGWVQDRCEREIADYKDKAQTARENGKRGGRPKKAEKENPNNQAGLSEETNPVISGFSKITQKKANQNQNQNQNHIKGPTHLATRPPNVSEATWGDFLQLRKAKKAPFTDTAFSGLQREAAAAGITVERALEVCCERGWQSFKASWFNGQKQEKGRVAI